MLKDKDWQKPDYRKQEDFISHDNEYDDISVAQEYFNNDDDTPGNYNTDYDDMDSINMTGFINENSGSACGTSVFIQSNCDSISPTDQDDCSWDTLMLPPNDYDVDKKSDTQTHMLYDVEDPYGFDYDNDDTDADNTIKPTPLLRKPKKKAKKSRNKSKIEKQMKLYMIEIINAFHQPNPVIVNLSFNSFAQNDNTKHFSDKLIPIDFTAKEDNSNG